MTKSGSPVCVLGAGITGLTTAIVLQSLGFRVKIVAEVIAQDAPHQPNQPFIPTFYAMASAYPHNLRVQNLQQVSDESQEVFSILASEADKTGVGIYRMFEVYEKEPGEAALGTHRMKFQTFDGQPEKLKKLNPPIRPGAKHVWGWTFESYFADMPLYLPFLWMLFQERGGTIIQATIHDRESVHDIADGQPVVNCLGLGSIDIFDDFAPANVMRGRQVVVPNAPMVRGKDGVPVAYDYTPTADVFARADGTPEYVHFFPRSDGWLLGQTREPGTLAPDGEWLGKPTTSQEVDLGGVSVPSPIIDLNRQLLKAWVGQDFSNEGLVGRFGYRYYRDANDTGVRLEKDDLNGAPLIHNYGHAGSGITMSWGCALQAARLLSSSVKAPATSANGNLKLESTIQKLACVIAS